MGAGGSITVYNNSDTKVWIEVSAAGDVQGSGYIDPGGNKRDFLLDLRAWDVSAYDPNKRNGSAALAVINGVYSNQSAINFVGTPGTYHFEGVGPSK